MNELINSMKGILWECIHISNHHVVHFEYLTILVSTILHKEIEENNRMGKTRDIFKKIRDTKGTFHAKMGK